MWRIALVLLCALTLPAANRERPVTKRRPARATVWSADAVNNASLKPRLGPRSTGPAVLRAQILLDRAHFSVGEMDGSYGENMRYTVKAYQTAHGLPSDGIVNRATWEALNADTAPAIAPYTITEADTAGPFEKIPEDMLEQAKLTALGYQSVIEELGERFHSSPKLLEKLNPGKHFDKAEEQIQAPQVAPDPIKGTVAKVVVTQATKSVEPVDAEGKVLAHYPATMGSQHDPLPVGDWKIHRPIQHPDFFYNSDLFWDADETHAKAKISPGPNNPVGVVWIGLSKEHYGIHGTPEPALIGKTQSHGCIRLTNWDAEDLAGLVKPNMPAILKTE